MLEQAVERALEAAIVAGELVPGGRGWKNTAAAIARATLVTPLDAPPGQTLASLVTTERAESWLRDAQRAADDGLVEWRERAVRRVLGPVEPPADVDTVVGPLAWLLRHASDGIELTQSRYIARALVVEAAEAFGWWDWDKPPRSEADLFQLSQVRDVATERRLVRRKGRALVVTTRGTRLLADPGALWLELAGTLGGNHRYDRTVAELVAHRLLDGRATDDDVGDAVHPVVLALGWRTEGGSLVRDDVLSAVWGRWRWWRLLGLVDEEPSEWDTVAQRQVRPHTTALTPAGEATVLAYLRGLATGPCHDLRA